MQCPLCGCLVQEREEVVGHGEKILVISCTSCNTEFKNDEEGNLITMASFAESLLQNRRPGDPRPEQQCPGCQRWVQNLRSHLKNSTKCSARTRQEV